MPGRSGQGAGASRQQLPASRFAGCTALSVAALKASAMGIIGMEAAQRKRLLQWLNFACWRGCVEKRSMLSKVRWELIPTVAAMAFILGLCIL